MTPQTPSGQQAVDIEAALRWADRHEARERQKLRDMGLPPEGDMPVPGAVFVRGLVAMLRTATPPAPSVPWEEQAAQIRNDALEEAAKVCDQRAKTAVSHMEATDVPSYKEAFARDAEEAEDCADDIRALLSKPAKGE